MEYKRNRTNTLQPTGTDGAAKSSTTKTPREPKVRNVPEIEVFARRTESVDEPLVQNLIDQCSLPLFPSQNFLILFEYSFFSVTICSKEEHNAARVIGFAAFSDYPVHHHEFTTDQWDSITHNGMLAPAEISGIWPATALFLHYFVARKRYQIKALECALRTAFRAQPYLERCCITLPVDVVELDSFIGKLFSIKFLCGGSEDADSSSEKQQKKPFCVFSCPRDAMYLPLSVRRSKVEDCDDLERCCIRREALTDLQHRYGRYWLAELIDMATRKGAFNCVTATVRWKGENRPVAFFYGTNDINIDLLVHTYYTEIFHHFTPSPRPRKKKRIPPPAATGAPKAWSPVAVGASGKTSPNQLTLNPAAPGSRPSTAVSFKAGNTPGKIATTVKSPTPATETTQRSATASPQQQKNVAADNGQSDEDDDFEYDEDDNKDNQPPSKNDDLGVDEFEAHPKNSDALPTLKQTSSTAGEAAPDLSRSKTQQQQTLSQLAVSQLQFKHDYLDDASFLPADEEDGESTTSRRKLFDETTRNAIRNNCIMIQLFAIANEFEQNYEQLLPYMFTSNPDAEFIILTVPSKTVENGTFLEKFTKIPARKGINVSQDLFAMHKLALDKEKLPTEINACWRPRL